jgi:hypothetical protein
MYATFRPTKGNTTTLRLLKCLGITLDVVLLLLAGWTIVNMCYPFWGWAIYASTWIGLFSFELVYWLVERFSIRSFIVAKIRPGDQLLHNGTSPYDLKHLGFLFSVWESPELMAFGYYDKYDTVDCLRKRTLTLGDVREFNKWLGWLVVLATDAIPLVLLATLLCAGYFLGTGTVIFFLLGVALAEQLRMLIFRLLMPELWEDRMFLDGRMCALKLFGAMMSILEGPEGELVLAFHDAVLFNHYTRRPWFLRAAEISCRCCSLLMDPALLGLEA